MTSSTAASMATLECAEGDAPIITRQWLNGHTCFVDPGAISVETDSTPAFPDK